MEMFSMDEPSHDVIGDGYDSLLNKILLKYNIQEYYGNNLKNSISQYDSALLNPINLGTSTIGT